VPQDGDGDAVGDGSDAAPPLRSGFALTGGGISGNTGTWRYQFSLGAPQPMGSGRSGEYQGTFGPAAAHRR
jgi:hypothetical protein